MRDRRHDARVAALWLLHAGSCAKLLRAHGRGGHADNFEAALDEVASIVAEEVGQDTLTEAMDWASGQLWAGAELATVQPGAKKRLH